MAPVVPRISLLPEIIWRNFLANTVKVTQENPAENQTIDGTGSAKRDLQRLVNLVSIEDHLH